MIPEFAIKLRDSRLLLVYGVLGFLLASLVTELLPFAFGTGSAATLDWSWVYVTSRYIVLPLGAVLLFIWSVQQLVLGIRLRQATSLWQASLGILVGSMYVAFSLAVPLPWLWLAVHGYDGPADVPGWLQ